MKCSVTKQLEVGPFTCVVFDGVAAVYRRGDVRWIDFPTPKAALDWIRFQLFGPFTDPVREAGEWLVTKFRTQIRSGCPERAELNMGKQGVPAPIRRFIVAGV